MKHYVMTGNLANAFEFRAKLNEYLTTHHTAIKNKLVLSNLFDENGKLTNHLYIIISGVCYSIARFIFTNDCISYNYHFVNETSGPTQFETMSRIDDLFNNLSNHIVEWSKMK